MNPLPGEPVYEYSSSGIVLALTLLVACWAVIGLTAAYLWGVGAFVSEALPFEDFDPSGLKLAALAARVVLQLIGWILVLIAIFRSEWDAGILNEAWANALFKALATFPAVAASALLTVLIAVFLPGRDGDRWIRAVNVFVCLFVAVIGMAGVFFVPLRYGMPGGNLVGGIVGLGYLPLLVVSVLFFATAVAFGFGAGWIHPRAGGIKTVLLAAGLATTFILLKEHGPVTIPATGGEVTAEIVEAELGLYGLIALLLAGALGIALPMDSSEAS